MDALRSRDRWRQQKRRSTYFAIARAVECGLGCPGMHTSLALVATLLLVQASGPMPETLTPAGRRALLEARESVWRSFFANDRAALEKLIPEETIVIDPGSEELGNRRSSLAGAARFAKRGATRVRLAFPTTEIQRYGSIAIIYSTYFYELEQRGKRTSFSGRITEVFVFRKDPWVNPGWHMEPTTASAADQ
jgi:hypothetical protein